MTLINRRNALNDFVIGCTHFGHRGICFHTNRLPWICDNPDYDTAKPYDFKKNNPKTINLKKHDEDLKSNWNSMVGRKDRIFILGDFAWKDHLQYILGLNGQKIFVSGNHDKMKQMSLSHFKEVHEIGCRKRVQEQDVTFSHYAMRSWASSCYGSWMLYSHSHGRMPEFDNMFSFDCGVDIWGYAPAPWNAIVEKMRLVQEKIDLAGGRFVDGEFAAKGVYDKDPDQRKLDTRAKNKQIMISLGYPINEVMWPTT